MSAKKRPYSGLVPAMGITVTEDSGEVHDELYIVGYDFQWGLEQRIEFAIEEVDEPLQDGPSRELVFEHSLGDTWHPPGTQFEMFIPIRLDEGSYLTAEVGDFVKFADGTRVACEGTLRDELLAPREYPQHRFVTFELTGEAVPLRCVSWRPWEPPAQ